MRVLLSLSFAAGLLLAVVLHMADRQAPPSEFLVPEVPTLDHSPTDEQTIH